jgi:hypothetical protein
VTRAHLETRAVDGQGCDPAGHQDRIATRSPPSVLTPWVVGACRDPQARSTPDVSAPHQDADGSAVPIDGRGVRHASGFRELSPDVAWPGFTIAIQPCAEWSVCPGSA